MSREDLTKIAATVLDVLGGGIFSVQLVSGQVIQAKLSGRLRKYHIRVIRGDKITVGISPYDLSHGLILGRERLNESRPPQALK